MHIFQVDGSEPDCESREEFARKAAAELWQESWIVGVPATETIFCAAWPGRTAKQHKSNGYDDHLLCNSCVIVVEVLIAQRTLLSVDSWVQEVAAENKLLHRIRELEQKGGGILRLPDGRYLEVTSLYEFTRHREYPVDEDNTRWPCPDMRPTIYRGWVRSNWEPG